MSTSIGITGYAGANSTEYQKHAKAVKFCIEYGLSYPKETSEFFKDKFDGGYASLEDMSSETILKIIDDGIQISVPTHKLDEWGNGYIIKVSEIPKEIEEIRVYFC